MRPLRLTFAGLRSYRDETTIDFADLDLFAIIGDTGAGKSTLIEALSFALYGRKTWAGSKHDDLIADGERTLRVELEFEADGQVWSVVRTRNRSSTPGLNKLTCRSTGENVDGAREVTDRVTAVLGLNHDQFVQAVVMPQGRFDRLLQSTRSERNKLLGSILGLDDVRSAGQRAKALGDRVAAVLTRLQGRREALPVDPVADLATAEGRAEATARDRDRLADLAAEAAGAQAEVDGDRRDRERLVGLLDAVDGSGETEVAALSAALLAATDLDERTAAVDDALATSEREVARLTDEESAVLDGFATRDAASAAAAHLRAGATTLDRSLDRLGDARADLDRLRSAPPTATVDPSVIDAADTAQNELDAAAEAVDRAQNTVDAARTVAAPLVQARAGAARLIGAVPTRRVAADEAAAQRTSDALAQSDAAAELAGAEAELQAARQADAAAAAAVGHEPGDDCPVCARSLPPDFVAPTSPGLDAVVARHREIAELAAAARTRADRSGAAAERLATELAQAEQAAEEAEAERSATERAATEVSAELDLTGSDVERIVAPLVATLAAARLARDGAAQDAASRAGELATARAEVAAAARAHEQKVSGLEAAVAGLEGDVAEATGATAELPGAWVPPVAQTGDDLRTAAGAVDAMLVRLADITARRQAAEVAAREATSTRTELGQQRNARVEVPVADARRALHRRRSQLDRLDAALSGDDAAEPADLDGLGPDALLAVAEGQVTDVAAVVARGHQQVSDLAASVEAASSRLDAALRTAERADLVALQQAAGAAGAEANHAADEVVRAEQRRTEVAGLDDDIARIRPFAANLAVLAATLTDRTFLDHLVKAREVELLAEATRRLATITGGRFGFASEFNLVNTASGELRSPDSLSGGERFQAALALALALVEIASRGAGKLDAVFIDEGFGSLDGAALESALDTLGTVAGGGKTVALISHLRPVAEYVEQVLHVTKDDTTGSRIQRLDQEARDRLLSDDGRSGLTR